MYWRYSANSVEKPVKGDRCRPEMKPSTTVRASNSSDVIRASTSGAKNLGTPEYAGGLCPLAGAPVFEPAFRLSDSALFLRQFMVPIARRISRHYVVIESRDHFWSASSSIQT